jgi:hypothetical protein
VTLQFGASLTDDTRSVNYDRNTFIIQATNHDLFENELKIFHLFSFQVKILNEQLKHFHCKSLFVKTLTICNERNEIKC